MGDERIGMESNFFPGFAPLAVGPVVVGQSDAEPGVADPIHKAQARTGCQAVAIVILDKQAVRGHPPCFA